MKKTLTIIYRLMFIAMFGLLVFVACNLLNDGSIGGQGSGADIDYFSKFYNKQEIDDLIEFLNEQNEGLYYTKESINELLTTFNNNIAESINDNIDQAMAALNDKISPVGSIVLHSSAAIPIGWRLCDGRSLIASEYPDLFAVIGTVFGGSGGNFNLPDLQGRFALGAGQGADLTERILKIKGGEETHRLTVEEMPSHGHGYDQRNRDDGFSGAMDPNYFCRGTDGKTTTSTGGDQAHNNMPPFLILNYIIKI